MSILQAMVGMVAEEILNFYEMPGEYWKTEEFVIKLTGKEELL